MVQNFLIDILKAGLNCPNDGKFKCSHTKYGIFCANCGQQMKQQIVVKDEIKVFNMIRSNHLDENDRGPQ